jgi:hypothetical protein
MKINLILYNWQRKDLSLQQLDFCCALSSKLDQTLVVPQLTLQRRKLAYKRFQNSRNVMIASHQSGPSRALSFEVKRSRSLAVAPSTL